MKQVVPMLLLLVLSFFLALPAKSQIASMRLWWEVQTLKRQDRQQPQPRGATLFVGSSSIRLWKSLPKMLPDLTIVNRGFGGSTLLDLYRYHDELVLPYRPAQLVIYSGENDIASGDVSAREVVRRFDRVFTAIRRELPDVPVVFISIKPSPSRRQYLPVIEEANALLKAYLSQYPHTSFVDVYTPMLNAEGQPRAELFEEDQLHMNEAGYRLWAERVGPFLMSE
jgi:lysophospholipase L1-like esterase